MLARERCVPGWKKGSVQEIYGSSLLPPPGHAFWRQGPDSVASDAHRAIAVLEAEHEEAESRAQAAQEARVSRQRNSRAVVGL